MLETNEPEYWEPVEPDIIMAIYPDIFFPFLKSHWVLVEKDGEKYIGADRKDSDNNSRNSNDLFTVITFVDSYGFKGSDSYSGEGMSLHIITTRKDLEKFVTDLEIEHNDFMKNR